MSFQKIIISVIMIFALTAFGAGLKPAYGKCGFKNSTPIQLLTTNSTAWRSITRAMSECGNLAGELDQNFQSRINKAFTASPAEYHIGGINSTMLPGLVTSNAIRPLDNLVARYGQHLNDNQLIRVNGKIMAIALMVNTQHLIYREDVFNALNIAPPKNYKELLKAAKKIRNSGLMDYPLGGTFKTGWNLGLEFINLYLGFGGTLFDETNSPVINNGNGRKTLKLMKALSEYMNPQYLSADTSYVQKQFQQGTIAMANLWASRIEEIDNPETSVAFDKIATVAAASVQKNGAPATTLWWDGIVIAKNISAKEAENAFRVAMEGTDTEMVRTNNNVAVWLISGFRANHLAKGAAMNADAGAPHYPSSEQMELLHKILGSNIANFLQEQENAKKTLEKIEKTYLAHAKGKLLSSKKNNPS